MKNYVKLPVALATGLLLCGVYSVAQAVQVQLDTGETIELDPGVVKECEKESLNLGACACVVSIMLEEENLTSMSLEQMIKLATNYPNEYQEAKSHCQHVN